MGKVWEKLKEHKLIIFITLVIVVIAILFLVPIKLTNNYYNSDWTGFAPHIETLTETSTQEDSKGNTTTTIKETSIYIRKAKTFWDFLELFIIPIFLALGLYFLNQSARNNEQDIATKNRKEDKKIAENSRNQMTLEGYFDKMTELILDRGLGKIDSDNDGEQERVFEIAITRTLSVLRSLDVIRVGAVFRFIDDVGLNISFDGKNLAEVDWEEAILYSVNLSGVNLEDAKLQGVNLYGASLHGAILKNANLEDANLENANLEGAYLHRANLKNANLKNANLRGAVLPKAHLEMTNLEGADLQGANLQGANLQGAILLDASLEEANLTEANLQGAYLQGASLVDADLVYANLVDANLTITNLQGAILVHAILKDAILEEANLMDTKMMDAKLMSANLERAELTRAVLEDANLEKAFLKNANLQGANFKNANLQGAYLSDATNHTYKQLTSAMSLDDAIMPDGTKYEKWIKEQKTNP